MSERVLVIGGLGFIGYHIVRELMARQYHVTIGARSDKKSSSLGPPVVSIDLIGMEDALLKSLLKSFDAVVFAGGVDDRKLAKGDAEKYFYSGNVAPCVRLARMSRETSVNKIIILGSYFSHFDRKHSEWKMTQRHPYVHSRLLQRLETKKEAGSEVQVTCLEIPYVFGRAPGCIPLWKPLLKYIAKSPYVLYTIGGTNICAVEQVADAVASIISKNRALAHYLVGGQNVSWKVMIRMMSRAMGKKRKVIAMPNFIVRGFAAMVKLYFFLARKESGLDPYYFIETQTANTYLDMEVVHSTLEIRKANMQDAINESVDACGLFRKQN